MELSIGKLPDGHPFITIIRPVTDWVFKFISWLVIAATLALAWQKTRNPFLAGAALVANVLPGAFIYSLLAWLAALDRGKTSQKRENAKGWWKRLRGASVAAASLGLWVVLTLATQVAVQQTAAAILEFQKSIK